MADLFSTRFKALIKALEAEKHEEQKRYNSKAKDLSIKARILDGICLYPLDFQSFSYSDSEQCILSFKINSNQNADQFRRGQPIEVFQSTEISSKGIVRSKLNNIIEVIIYDEHILDWIKEGKIGVNILADSKTIDFLVKDLKVQLEKPSNITKYFYQHNADSIKYSNEKIIAPNLNDSQINAVENILNDCPISILHGPPGTGKSTTLIAAIQKLHSNNKRIYISAPTHTAIDHLANSLIKKNIDFVRIGNDLKVADNVEPFLLDAKIKNDRTYQTIQNLSQQKKQLEKKAFQFKRNFGKEEFQERKKQKAELKSLRNDIRHMRNDISNFVLKETPIVLGTFIGLKQIEDKLGSCDYLIIDEAAQAIEPAIWLLSHLANKLVLAGDHCQLPATIFSNTATKLGLDKSVIEMAKEIDYPTLLLAIQYRMPENLIAFSNHYFYNDKIQSFKSNQNDIENLSFIDTAGCGHEEIRDEEFGGLSNLFEQTIIKALLPSIKDSGIGIISPYRKQVDQLREELANTNLSINTIDGFQGQEKSVIIISLVRSNELQKIGFLKDYRRMNVALTRAKTKLIIIGDSSTFGHDEFYSQMLDHIEKNGTYRSGWEFMT